VHRHLQAVALELEVANDLGAKQRERVGTRGGAHARPELLGHARPTYDVAALEHLDGQTRAREVGGRSQAVVAGPDDHGVQLCLGHAPTVSQLPVSTTLLATAAATLFMTGLIWFVQVVHYPLLAEVGEREFARFHELHSRRVTWIVPPVMAVELVTALVLALAPPDGVPGGLAGRAWHSRPARGSRPR